jgi:hypothetical protein
MPTNDPIEINDSEPLPNTTEKVQEELTNDDLQDVSGGLGSSVAGIASDVCISSF